LGFWHVLILVQGPTDPSFAAQSRAPDILIGSLLPIALAIVLFLALFYSRFIIMKNRGKDDTCFSLLGLLLESSFIFGAGRHLIVQTPGYVEYTLLMGVLRRTFTKPV